jgi:hypothetical protein
MGISTFLGKIAVLIAVCGWALSAQAKYSGGTGWSITPYKIARPEDLIELSICEEDWGKYFILVNDIDMEGYTITQPIGRDALRFTGVLDGKNKKIWNFTWTSNGSNYIGLFGCVDSTGEIKNLGMENVNVDAEPGYPVGGLVGRNWGTITNCYVIGSVSGSSDVGGLVGHSSGTISDCYVIGSVSGTVVRIGGLVGNNSGTISNCHSSGSVSGGSWYGSWWVGGLVGFNTGPISNCYSTGSVCCTGSGVGGVGGLVGKNWGTISNCYSIGSVRGLDNVGGLVGGGPSGDVISSFWDIETSGQLTSNGGIGKTTVQMKTANTFLGWVVCGSEGIWTLDEGNDYPRLAWEGKPGQPFPKLELSDFLEGTGTASDPYLIYTAEDLNLIGLILCECDKHFILNADINLADYDGTQFNVIGIGNGTQGFTGVFDGNNHKVWDFTWNSTSRNRIGLFGYLDTGGEIKNLGMENVDINAVNGGSIGGLAGDNSGTITNCYSTGRVSGGDSVGGLVGSGGTITGCYSTANVSGGNYVGGLGGRGGTTTNCYSTGSVSGASYVGGLIGDNGSGTIGNSYSTGRVLGSDRVGGLVGWNEYCEWLCFPDGFCWEDCGYGTITASFWDIETSEQSTSAGGTPKTTAEMQTLATFTDAGWDFVGETTNDTNDIWRMCVDGVQYPLLSWQYLPPDFVCPYGVDVFDLAFFVGQWLGECDETNDFCNSADTNYDRQVDFRDFAILAEYWPYKTIRQGRVIVDGDLSEWQGVEWIRLDNIYDGHPDDVNSAKFALFWNEDTNKIYAAVVVNDRDHVFRDDYGTWNASDRIEVYSQGDAEGGSGWTRVYDIAQQYMVGPRTLGGSWAYWGVGESIGSGAGLEYAVTVNGNQIIYEVGVTQFDNYGGFSGGDTIKTQLKVGKIVRFDMVIDTRYSEGFGMLSENTVMGKYNNANSIALYKLE